MRAQSQAAAHRYDRSLSVALAGNTPIAETVAAFEQLQAEGKIRRWGVSNFDLADMEELSGGQCSVNQVLYNLENRGIEFDLLPWSEKNKIPVMAYSPVGHGKGLLENATLKKIAKRHEATPAQIALAWVLRRPNVIAIPKATNEIHLRANAQALELKLKKEDLTEIDHAFPPPKSKQPLAML